MTTDHTTAIVTGGAGFIGSHLVDALVERGDRVAVIDDMSGGKMRNLNPAARLYEMDIRDEAVGEVVSAHRPGMVYHAAAQMSVSVSAREPVLDADVNIMGTLNVLRAMRRAGGGKMVFLSTGGAMYGEPDVLPAPESAAARPGAPYGASKLAVENYLPVFRDLYGIGFSILRLTNVYGPRQDPHGEAGVVAIFARAMLSGGSVRIFGDGEDTRDYVYVGDAVEAMLRAGSTAGTGPYNIGTGVGVSVNDLAARLSRLTGCQTLPLHGPRRPGDLRHISLDAALARRELGWSASTSLDEGLRLTVEWFRTEVGGGG